MLLRHEENESTLMSPHHAVKELTPTTLRHDDDDAKTQMLLRHEEKESTQTSLRQEESVLTRALRTKRAILDKK